MWHHTWWKNWVNCAVLTGNSAGFGTVLSSHLSHRELRSSLRESPQFPQFTCRHHDGIISRYSIHSAVEHCMIYSFSNTNSYSTFYAFFSSFLDNIMADVACLQQTTALFLSTIVTRTRRHITDKKNWQTWWETCSVPGNIHFSFSCSFFTQLNCTV